MSDRRAVPRLAELTWTEAAAWFRRDPRLIIPVGTCLQHGPHLPLHADSLIITAIAEVIAGRHRVLLAPTLPFGAGSAREQEYAGTASIRSKTLHRVLNELVGAWERQGVREFLLITAQGFGPHYGALVTVISERARIRALDINTVDLSGFLDQPGRPEHAGQLETSLLLFLAPELVRCEHLVDAPIEAKDQADSLGGSEPTPPPGSPGVVGRPSLATAEKGRRVYEYLVEYLGSRLYGDGEPKGGG